MKEKTKKALQNLYNPKPKEKIGHESVTKSMSFDVDSLNDGIDVIHHFGLKDVQGFSSYPGSAKGELNRDKFIKYIILLYSVDSILNKRPPMDLSQRKLKAAEIAGFERNSKGEFGEDVVEKLFNLKSIYVIEAIFGYLKYQNNHLWTVICSTEQALMESSRIIITPVSDEKDKDNVMSMKNKLQLIPMVADTKKLLDTLYKDLFQDNTDVQKEVMVTKRKYFRVENLARDIG